jgi:hypothetical protein
MIKAILLLFAIILVLGACSRPVVKKYGDVRDRRAAAFMRIDSLYRCHAITADEAINLIRGEEDIESMELQ